MMEALVNLHNIIAFGIPMTADEFQEKLERGLALAERRMLEEKTIRGEILVQGTPDGRVVHVPAREVLERLYPDSPALRRGC